MSQEPSGTPQKSTNVRSKELFAIRVAGAVLRAMSRLSPNLTAAAYERLFLHTRRHRPPQREKPWMEGAHGFIVAAGTHQLQAWRWGESTRPTILLVHGWEGRGSQMGAFVRPLLDAGFGVVTFDHPGHGQSTGKNSSIVEMANAVLHVSREVGTLSGIIAHSAGGAATTVALRHLPPVERLVYIAVPADAGRFLYQVGEMLGLPRKVVDRTRQRIERRFNIDWQSLASIRLAPSLDTPLLLIHDQDDREIPHSAALELQAAWPDARLITTEGLGHRRILYAPEVVRQAIGFLTRARDAPVQTAVA